MKLKHEHYDLIVAWASGEDIEFYDEVTNAWEPIDLPSWTHDVKYRIKQPSVTVYIYKNVVDGEIYATNEPIDSNAISWKLIKTVDIEY